MKTLIASLSLSLFLFAGFLLPSQECRAADLDQAAFNKAMESYLSSDENAEKIGNALRRYVYKKQQEEQANQQRDAAAKQEKEFENPVDVKLGDAPVRGPKDAKVTVVEFSDYQCPFCKRGAATMKQLAAAYPNDVRIAFKNLPLQGHPQARNAAYAATAAGRQGKFWEMHDKLFEKQEMLADGVYEGFAKEIGLNVEKFKKDMADPAVQKYVDADQEQATQLGLRGTPAYFVNGVTVSGALPIENFKQLVDRWLDKLNNKK